MNIKVVIERWRKSRRVQETQPKRAKGNSSCLYLIILSGDRGWERFVCWSIGGKCFSLTIDRIVSENSSDTCRINQNRGHERGWKSRGRDVYLLTAVWLGKGDTLLLGQTWKDTNEDADVFPPKGQRRGWRRSGHSWGFRVIQTHYQVQCWTL